LPRRVRDFLLGDLAEEYGLRSRSRRWRDRFAATLWYWKQPLRIREVTTGLTPHSVRTLDRQMASVLAPERAGATLVAGLGGVGLLLAAVGLYGVVAAGVARRTREIGVRMALGAGVREVRGMVVRRGMTLVAAGTLVGIPLAFALVRLVEGAPSLRRPAESGLGVEGHGRVGWGGADR